VQSIATLLTSNLGNLVGPLRGFGVEVVLSALIYLHYRRFGSALTGKQGFGPVLPFVGLTTFLVITAVKSSFALSLGLVGALSIVRFRTPVKDPEELAYIFLTIASGIGTAAGQLTLTATIVPLILVIITITRRSVRHAPGSLFISIDVPGSGDAEVAYAAVTEVLRANTHRLALLRYEHHGDVMHVTAEAEVTEGTAISRITAQLRQRYAASNVTSYDESRLPAP